jgi:hypothetical protein
MRTITAFVTIVLIAGAAMAALPVGEKKVTADGNVNVRGSAMVELLADGEAKITIRRNGGISYPLAAGSDTSFTINDGVARTFTTTMLEDVYVDLVDASYVIVTWQ